MSYAMVAQPDQSGRKNRFQDLQVVTLLEMTRLSLAVMAVGLGVAITADAYAQQNRPPARQNTQPANRAPAQQRAPAPAPAPAPTPSGPRSLGTFEAWTAIEMVERSGKTCYMVGYPTAKEPKNRGDVMLTVSHRPSAKQENQVSYHPGYPYKPDAPVTIEIERRKFELFTRPEIENDVAWAKDEAADKALVDAMRAGKSMTVSGTSARGTKTLDTIQLNGFSRALTEINKACNIK
jgi:hypothetical protein